MYIACGFRETGRHPREGDPSQTVVEYAMPLHGFALTPRKEVPKKI
jgi:hypothetical protein